MAIREIEFTAMKNGIKPATRQVIGVQDDHRATNVSFALAEDLLTELNEERESGSVLYYRFDVYDGAGGVIRTDSQILDAQTESVSVQLDDSMTRYGGNLQVYLVITAVQDDTTVLEVNSFPAQISMKKKPAAQEKDDDSRESLTTLAESARENARIAEESAAVALDGAGRTENARRSLEDGDYFVLDGGTATSEFPVGIVLDDMLSTTENGHGITNKAVSDTLLPLVEVVGTTSSGLVKNVSDLQNDTSELQNTVGDSSHGLVKDFADLQDDVETLKKDYIVAHGTTNGWTWRKWESGVAECFISTTVSSYTLAGFSPLYYVEGGVERNLPFSFTSVASKLSSINIRRGIAWTYFAKYDNASDELIKVKVMPVFAQNTSNNSPSFEVNISVVGRWK